MSSVKRKTGKLWNARASRFFDAQLGAGSVRTDLEAGEVTYKDVVNILPYCNEIPAKYAEPQGRIRY